MNSMNAILENDILTISLSGKIDSLNAFEIEDNLKQIKKWDGQIENATLEYDLTATESFSDKTLPIILLGFYSGF